MNRREAKKLVHRMAFTSLKCRWEHLASKDYQAMSASTEGMLRLMLKEEDLKRMEIEMNSLLSRLDEWSKGWDEVDGGRFKDRC